MPLEHREFAERILDEYEVPPLAEGHTFGDHVDGGDLPITGNHTYTLRDVMPAVEVSMASNVKLFANALGVAPRNIIDGFHERGILVAGLAGQPRHGEKHLAGGTDIVVCTGAEAGGHTGEIGSMVLIPDMVDACGGLPVLAGGGIASGRQMAAAMVLGASGAWCGSVWLTTQEAETPTVVKEKFVQRLGRRHRPLTLATRAVPRASCAQRGPMRGRTRAGPTHCRCRCRASSRPSRRSGSRGRPRPARAERTSSSATSWDRPSGD